MAPVRSKWVDEAAQQAAAPDGRPTVIDVSGPQFIQGTLSVCSVPNLEVRAAMTRHLFAVALVAVTLGACTASPPASVAGIVGVSGRAAVEGATAAFHQALRTNDLETFMSYVAEDVSFMPPGEPPVRGRDAVRQWLTGFLAQYHTSSLTLADREVLVGSGWAVELGTFEWALQPAAGGSAIVDRGNYMQVWQEQSDKTWRFAREVYNSSVPPAPVTAK